MPPRRRPQFTQESIDQQLQQIHLLDPSSSSENLEQLGPVIKQIHTNKQQEAYLRTIHGLIESKDAEIEKICADNYQDFISSVSTMFTVKAYTDKMKENIAGLDANVSQLGRGLVDKKRTLLRTRKTAANLDEGIDSLQACLRVLDVVNRVGEMVQAGKYWSALRSLEDIESMPPTSLSQTPFFQHLLSSLPSLRTQIKDAVTASVKQWLLEIRNISAEVGRLAMDAMDARNRRWRARRDRDPLLQTVRVGSAVELVTYEKTEFNVLDNEHITVDFKPLYECIHIYSTLNSLDDLRRSYQADRKAQSDLILPNPLPLPLLQSLTQEISGFFLIETRVLDTTDNFRSERDVEELWEAVVSRLSIGVDNALQVETDPGAFLQAKEYLTSFMATLESPIYQTNSMSAFLLLLFEKYALLLEKQFSRRFENIVLQDDHLPLQAETSQEVDSVLDVVWLGEEEKEQLRQTPVPLVFPWSQTFYLCCQDIRSFIQKFYQFIEGISQTGRNDELLCKSLDALLSNYVSKCIGQRLAGTTTLSQIAQIITNLEYFQAACPSIETFLTNSRGCPMKLSASSSFQTTLTRALERVTGLITSKLDDFFELSEYDWTPRHREDTPSMYLYELINWLTTVVDSLVIKEDYKDEAYKGAVAYIAECLMDFLTGRNVAVMNESAISNILVDVDFLENELKRIGRAHLCSVFTELRLTTSIPLENAVQDFLIAANRLKSYSVVRPKRLQALLEKLAKYGTTQRDAGTRELAERRRKEADAVGRIFPGELR
ncbi:hypothetical protein EYR36_006446 [Pleurotus pulmonarius]|nr:hypothetical protein EYR36_006446 [Pleurotus pulmonarius]KAF4601146.1 hypothetical protein EYR38_005796 [Pleurotus pulmonarius]